MKKVLLHQQMGDGLRFTFVTTGKPEELESFDGRTVGNAVFYVANILNLDEFPDGYVDRDHLVLTIPYIMKCPVLDYDRSRNLFKEMLTVSNVAI